MRKTIIFTIVLVAASFYSCKDKIQSEVLSKIEQKVTKDGGGIDIKYKSLELKAIDTFTVFDKINQLNAEIDSAISFLELDVISEEDLIKENLVKLRNQENQYRIEMNRSMIYPEKDYDYYKFVFSEECTSEWCENLRNNIISIDSFIEKDQIDKYEKLDFYSNIIWFKRIGLKYDDANSEKLRNAYQGLLDEIDKLKLVRAEIIDLEDKDKNSVIHYKYYNKYTIINPLLNNAKVTIEHNVYFDENYNLINREVLD
jgi:hypothetical protein